MKPSLRPLMLALVTASCGPTAPDSRLDADESAPYAAPGDLFVGFWEKEPTADDKHVLVVGAPTDVRDVVLCESATAVECAEGSAGFARTSLHAERGGRKFFKAASATQLRSGLSLAVTAFDASGGRATRVVRLSKVGEPDPIPPVAAIDVGAAPRDYLSLSGVHAELRRWAAVAPTMMAVTKYADVNGSEAVYLRISKAVGNGANLPKVLITAATHGDEKVSTATVLGVVHKLLSQYGRDAAVTALLDSRDIYVAPTFCPDGYAANTREVDGGRDPNRSFQSPVNPGRAMARCSEAATKLFHEVKFNATIDYHAFGRMMMYPWSHKATPIEGGDFDRKYRILAQKMAQSAQYQFGQIPAMVGTIAEGSSGDYFHWQGNEKGYNTAAMAVEVALTKRPDRSQIQVEVDRNVEALKTFINDAPIMFRPAGSGLREGPADIYDGIEAPEAPASAVFPAGFVIGED